MCQGCNIDLLGNKTCELMCLPRNVGSMAAIVTVPQRAHTNK